MKTYKLKTMYPSIPSRMEVGDEVVYNESMGLYSHDKTLSTFHISEIESNPSFWTNTFVPSFTISKQEHGEATEVTRTRDWLNIAIGSKIKTQCEEDDFLTVERFLFSRQYEGGLGLVTSDGKQVVSISIVTEVQEPIFVTEDGVGIHQGDSYSFFWVGDKIAKGQTKFKVYDVESAFTFAHKEGLSPNAKFYSSNEAANNALVDKYALFLTYSGEPVFEGESWWYVVEGGKIAKQTNTLTYGGKSKSRKEVTRFKTQKQAQEFIIENEACLSLREIRSIVKSTPTEFVNDVLVILVLKKLGK